MQNPIPLKVSNENLKFYNTTQGAYIVGILGHAFAIFGFWNLGIKEMVYFNAFISVPAFLSAFVINRLGRHNLAFSFAFFELFVHQIIGVYFTGWGYGLQFWLIYLAGLSFFNPQWNTKVQYLLLALIAGTYVFLFLNCQEGVYLIEPNSLQIGNLSNAIFAIAVLSLLINYYSKSTLRAEKKLIAEKEITEQQNKQLTEQHETLVIEQDKTNRLLNKVESLFGQQVSQEVAQAMINSESEIDSKIYDATVMFLDIRDFTVFADSREPSEVAKFQNIVFSELIEIVRLNKGIVNQILGDGILALFGAPVENKDHVKNAVKAGYEMIEKVNELGESGKIPPIKIGIGLNSGKIMAGNVGNDIRKFYSITGTNVIIASRIEQLNKTFNSQFLVSENIYSSIKDDAPHLQDHGEIALKGIEKKISVYQLV